VHSARKEINAQLCDGIIIDSSYGSVAAYADSVWFQSYFEKYLQHPDQIHLDLHQVICIGKHIDAGQNMLFVSFSTVSMLLNLCRAMNSGWAVTLQGDVTHKICSAAVDGLGLGVNSLGTKCNLLVYSLIPAGTESKAMYGQVWECVRSALYALLRKYKSCGVAGCKTCHAIANVREGKAVREYLRGGEGSAKSRHTFTIDQAIGDNHTGYQNWVQDEHGIPPDVCATHLTAVAKNNGKQKKHFDNGDNYEMFYKFTVRAIKCAWVPLADKMPGKICEWMLDIGETRAEEWFSKYWCGNKGRWMLAYAGYGGTIIQNSIESGWKYMKLNITQGLEIGIGLYIAGMVKHLHHSSVEAFEALGENNGSFTSTPIETKQLYDKLQAMHPNTFDFCRAVGASRDWKAFVEGVSLNRSRDDDPLWKQLYDYRERAFSATMTREVVMPSDRLMKCISADMSHMTLPEQKRCVESKMDRFMAVVRGDVDDMLLHDVLDSMEEFHLLTRLDRKWSDWVRHKCSCVESFKYGICHHAALLAMVSDVSLSIPTQYCRLAVQSRAKRGRPSADPRVAEALLESDARQMTRAGPLPPTVPVKATVTSFDSESGEVVFISIGSLV
jgi:hypothetical protein